MARSRWRRWRGLRPRPRGYGLILSGSSVHGRGLREPLRLVGVGHNGIVTSTTVLLPGAFRRLEGAAFVIELPLWSPVPGLDRRLELFPMVEE